MSELPTGAVTFLFTDIEGSTRLVKELRGRWADALADHQALFRAAVEKYGGREIDTQGDAFFVAFSSARNAVQAAVEAQRALEAHTWPEGARLRVRMGIHTGEAAVSGERYLGLAVHRAARICAAAHGGQVLVSQTTIHLLEDEEQELGDIVLRDLGEQRLKDLDRPVRLYQLAAPDLAESFPPPRTAETPYSGREGELADAAAAAIAVRGRRVSPALVLGVGAVLALGAAALVYALSRDSGSSVVVAPNSVGIIDPAAKKVVGQLPVGKEPGAVAVTSDAVWVANVGDRTLTRIDPARRTVVRTISLVATPTGLAATRDALWVANGLLGAVARVDPQFDQVVATVPDVSERSGGGAIAAGAEGVWFVSSASTVARISRANRVSLRGFAGTTPAAIATGAGAVWVANADGNDVSQINPRTATPAATVTVGHHPRALCVAAGAVWVAAEADDAVTRIDADSRSTTTIEVGHGPAAIACGADAVWVANAGDGTVSRIDVGTRAVDAVIRVGNHPGGLAAGAGAVWVSVQAT